MLLHKVFFPFDRRRKKIELRYVVHIDKKKRRVFTDVGFSFVPLLHTQRIQEDNKRWADQSTSPKAKTQIKREKKSSQSNLRPLSMW